MVDTDYDNFLLTYRCREEFRTPNENDAMMEDNEKYREMREEFDPEKHPRMLA